MKKALLLKWVGGKTQLLDNIKERLPKEINNYYEIFLGGGSVLFMMLNMIKKGDIKLKGKVYAYDFNEPLIGVYKNIQNNHEELIKEVNKLKEEHNSNENKENHYYEIREKYNKLKDKKTIESTACFMFLNKTCFRGLYREGPNGFNVPYGNYKNPAIIDEEYVKEINELIKDVVFECISYSESLKKPKKGDFVYMDPPYAPETKTSFVKYTEKGFTLENHEELFDMIKKLKKNVKFLLHNADVSLVKDNFADYTIDVIEARRAINSRRPDAKTNEVIIVN